MPTNQSAGPQSAGPWSRKQEGMTLFIMAALLFVMLGMAAVAIDLVAFYVNRSEAQRAADAAALAGAKKFLLYVNGASPQFVVEAAARQEAQDVGAQNVVGGQAAQIAPGDVTFDFSVPNNPRITVTVQRTAASQAAGFADPVPTFFGKALGVAEVDIAAVATAEAYKPGAGDPPVCVGCIKPWIMPNCDPNNDRVADPDPNNPPPNYFCPPGTDQYIDDSGAIINEEYVIGQMVTLKFGQPQDAPAPSQFYPIQIPPGTTPEICPACAQNPGGSEGPGAALYRHNIACCNTNHFVCGQDVPIEQETGNMVGPTGQGVQCLIHQGPGNQGGQDEIVFDANGYHVEMGANNPMVQLGLMSIGDTTDTSSSFVTIPLYDGHVLCPGGSCGTTVRIVGFLEVFIIEVGQPQNTVVSYITGISGCGSGGSSANCDDSDTSDTVGTGGQLVPVRLIRN